jgi:hypothetical protein
MNVIRRMVVFLGRLTIFDQGSSFRLLSLRDECECNRSSFLVTVFYSASSFNGNVNQWNVANVNTMGFSESICIVGNGLTYVNSSYCVIGEFRRRFGVGGDHVM